MLPCPPRLEELCLSGVPIFQGPALVPRVPLLRTLQLSGKERLDVPALAAMTALQSLRATTPDTFAAVGDAVPALTHLTRLIFCSDVRLGATASSASGSAAQSEQLSIVLRQLSALASLRILVLCGMNSMEAQALGGQAAFPSLESLRLQYCRVLANEGLLEFLGRQSRLAAVGFTDMRFVGTKSALSAFKASLAWRFSAYVHVSVDRWHRREP